jgi:hypothetical protein
MASFVAADSGVEVARRENAVAVTIPSGVELGEAEAKRINDAYFERVRQNGVDAALTVLHSETPLDGGAFEEVRKAGAASYDLGVTRWAVVATQLDGAGAFADHIEGIQTREFETVDAALDWLAEA